MDKAKAHFHQVARSDVVATFTGWRETAMHCSNTQTSVQLAVEYSHIQQLSHCWGEWRCHTLHTASQLLIFSAAIGFAEHDALSEALWTWLCSCRILKRAQTSWLLQSNQSFLTALAKPVLRIQDSYIEALTNKKADRDCTLRQAVKRGVLLRHWSANENTATGNVDVTVSRGETVGVTKYRISAPPNHTQKVDALNVRHTFGGTYDILEDNE